MTPAGAEGAVVIERHGSGCAFWVWVQPRAAADRLAGTREGALVVRVTAPPADGRANEAVCRVLADALGVATGAVRIVAGQRSRRKRVTVVGPDPAEVEGRLKGLLP